MERGIESQMAGDLRVVISRLVKIIRCEVKQDQLLSLTERSTLSLVYQHTAMLPSELASLEKVTNQSMSQIINKLSRLGYVNKTSSTTDRRKVIVSITTTGKKFIDKKREDSQEWLAKSIREKTTQREKEILSKAITVLTKLVDLK